MKVFRSIKCLSKQLVLISYVQTQLSILAVAMWWLSSEGKLQVGYIFLSLKNI